MLACENCGANNEAKLTFCRTCGERLPKVRQAPPPDGQETLREAARPEPHERAAAEPVAPLEEKRRPEPPADEPVIQLKAEHRSEPPAPAPSAPEPPAARPDDDQLKCSQCGIESPKDYRFCVGCGAVLPRKRPAAGGGAGAVQRGRQPVARVVEEDARPATSSAPEPPAKPEPRPEIKLEPRREMRPELKLEPRLEPKVASVREPEPEPRPEPKRTREDDSEPVVVAQKSTQIGGSSQQSKPAEDDEVTGRLVVIVEDGSEGTTLDLKGRQVDIGSAEGDIVLGEDRYLSGRHARLFRQDGDWYLRDLESLNGVYRRLRSPTPLRDGDRILMGLEVLRFEVSDRAERGLGQALQHGVFVFGSPSASRRARLAQRTVEGVTRNVYHLVSDETTIGREAGDVVFTTDPFMSRRHAMVHWHEDSSEFVLSDLSSSNGTYLAIRRDVRLEDGDFIRLGQHLFRVDLPESEGHDRR